MSIWGDSRFIPPLLLSEGALSYIAGSTILVRESANMRQSCLYFICIFCSCFISTDDDTADMPADLSSTCGAPCKGGGRIRIIIIFIGLGCTSHQLAVTRTA